MMIVNCQGGSAYSISSGDRCVGEGKEDLQQVYRGLLTGTKRKERKEED